MDNPNNTYAVNTSMGNNSLYVSPLSGPGFVAFSVVMLLAVVLPVIVANTVILVALVLESSTAKVVRLVLGSILVSCLLAALGLAMYHISGIILGLSPVNNPPRVPCTITILLIGFGAETRLFSIATFAVIVYIIKSGKDTKKHTFVAVLTAVVTLWVLAFLGVSPLLSQDITPTKYVDSLSCGIEPPIEIRMGSYILGGLNIFFFALVPLCLIVVFLVITACFIKYHSFTDIQATTAMVKFAFFLFLSSGLNTLLYTVLTSMTIFSPITNSKAWIYSSYTLLNTSFIPTPILITIYFKPIRKRLWHWLCCCMLKKRVVKLMNKHSTVEARSTISSEKAMKEVQPKKQGARLFQILL